MSNLTDSDSVELRNFSDFSSTDKTRQRSIAVEVEEFVAVSKISDKFKLSYKHQIFLFIVNAFLVCMIVLYCLDYFPCELKASYIRFSSNSYLNNIFKNMIVGTVLVQIGVELNLNLLFRTRRGGKCLEFFLSKFYFLAVITVFAVLSPVRSEICKFSPQYPFLMIFFACLTFLCLHEGNLNLMFLVELFEIFSPRENAQVAKGDRLQIKQTLFCANLKDMERLKGFLFWKAHLSALANLMVITNLSFYVESAKTLTTYPSYTILVLVVLSVIVQFASLYQVAVFNKRLSVIERDLDIKTSLKIKLMGSKLTVDILYAVMVPVFVEVLNAVLGAFYFIME